MSGGFLAAVLQRMEAERDEARRIVGAPDAEDAALLAQLVVSRTDWSSAWSVVPGYASGGRVRRHIGAGLAPCRPQPE